MDTVSQSLEDTLLSQSTDEAVKAMKSLSADFTEINLDTLIQNEDIRALPIVKTLLIVPKLFRGITNYLVLRKVLRFLFQLKDISIKDRRKFLENLGGRKREEILSNLILVLERHDHLQKSELQGRLFGAYIKGELNFDEYMSLTYALNMMDVKTLPALASFYLGELSDKLRPETIYNFIFLQLVAIDNSLVGTLGGGGPQYNWNRLGMLMVEVCADIKIPEVNRNRISGR